MDAVKFLAEYNRMCNTYNNCVGCPMHDKSFCHPHDMTTNSELKNLVIAVERWSCEHSMVTNDASDTVSRAAAIDAIDRAVTKEAARWSLQELPSAEAKTKCIAQIKVDTEELVKRIKEEYDIADGWIPVSDRLPEKDGYYLVSEDDGNIEVEWYDNTGWGYCGVIAWMFLPTPYRKEPNDEMVCYEIQREDSAAEDDKRFFNALKPNKEIDRSWGIGVKVPVCPNCEAIISPMCFWKNCGDKVGWCEYCGQKIDWSGWEDE